MSYILDALKKADHERRQGSVPSLENSSPAPAQQPQHNRNMIFVLAFALLMVVIVWFKPWQEEGSIEHMNLSSQATQTKTMSTQSEPVRSGADKSRQPIDTLSAQVTLDEMSEKPVLEAVSTPQQSVSDTGAIPRLMTLPAQTRNSLPAIQISGHIYDPTPANRMVIINGQVEREGHFVSDGLILEKITEDGIVLNYSGTLFFMNVFDSWPI